ncbi:TPA: acylneuraminate cytidylyltransferase family protein BpsG [Bacillus tropicus]|uniref:acylneuraminate cytidylyltransferase family protein BpsG n=1 Tax=Bacillus cereus group TaxID=86661 RepID=UPI00003CB5CF|nr:MULTISPECIES: acylneuraminate cytidylyltransferase family protein BpsG [Bacillus cereus group]AIY72935.1 cytidylyltransferase family protein [Bacillus cereus]AJI08113.1 cytidylyltransferase family protein [Bacillus cereus G9241]EAL15978.1 CMP-sialic acid synthetase, putative [Bacillus cereus G9241]QPS53458.1 acylneuraminate cytidylyltransferase family protein [Bacillus tropicus]
MYGGKTFVAIIPARGGSKGIPQKNVSVVGGKPLIQYTIDEAQNSKYLDDFIVSTDDREIAKIAKGCGAKVPFLRPKELAGDKIKTIDVLIHAVQSLSVMGKKYDYVVLLQPTQPLRKSMHIDEAIQHIIKKKEQSLVSVNEVNEHPLLMRSINEKGHLESLLKVNSTVRRQDFLKFFKINGAIYINKINENFNQNTSLNDNRLAYVMEKKYDLDIDELKDLEKFKHLISKELNTG